MFFEKKHFFCLLLRSGTTFSILIVNNCLQNFSSYFVITQKVVHKNVTFPAKVLHKSVVKTTKVVHKSVKYLYISFIFSTFAAN